MKNALTIETLDALLPQTQCRQCEFEGCRPYAKAMVEDNAPINRCIPGGTITMQKIATILQKEELPLTKQPPLHKVYASIQEDLCIGCTKCIAACPVDAIVGAQKTMHTVITQDCTGCELCLPACPMECIDLIPHQPYRTTWDVTASEANKARMAFENRNHRINLVASQNTNSNVLTEKSSKINLKQELQEAIARAKQKKTIPFWVSHDTDV